MRASLHSSIKALRWASDRLNDEGTIAFILPNCLIHDESFASLRKHLAQDFDQIYLIDFGNNLYDTEQSDPDPQTGISLNILIRKVR